MAIKTVAEELQSLINPRKRVIRGLRKLWETIVLSGLFYIPKII